MVYLFSFLHKLQFGSIKSPLLLFENSRFYTNFAHFVTTVLDTFSIEMYDCIADYLRLLGELDLFRLDVCLRGGDRERLELDPRLLEDEE